MAHYAYRVYPLLQRAEALPNDSFALSTMNDGSFNLPPADTQIGGISHSVRQWISATSAGTLNLSLVGCKANSMLVLILTSDTDGAGGVPNPTTPPNGGGLSWNKLADAQATASCNVEIWGASFVAGGNITVNAIWGNPTSGTLFEITGSESTFSGSIPTPITGQVLPQMAITTGRDDSIVIAGISDWWAIDGVDRRYLLDPKETFYERNVSTYATYQFFRYFPQTGTFTLGLTVPSSPSAGMGMVMIELRKALSSVLSFNQHFWN